MYLRFIFLSILAALITSCSTKSVAQEETSFSDRSVAALQCKDLFDESKARIRIVEDPEINKRENIIQETSFKLIGEVIPKLTDEAIWKVIAQLSLNQDAKLSIGSSNFTLTSQATDKLKLHSSYAYDATSNTFVLTKIEYTEANRTTKLLTDEPLYNQHLRDDLLTKLNEVLEHKINQNIEIVNAVPFEIYKKVTKEQKNLELFTTHELLKLSQLPLKMRMAKYNFLLTGRKIRNFIMQDFFNEVIKNPIKTTVITFMSVAIMSHMDVLPRPKIISVKSETPQWVAPTVVKLAGRYPKDAQTEIVHLMKLISSHDNDTLASLAKNMKLKSKMVNIDMVDQFTIQHDKKNDKTYFVLHHENDAGNVEVYATQIDPTRFPNLAKRAQDMPPVEAK